MKIGKNFRGYIIASLKLIIFMISNSFTNKNCVRINGWVGVGCSDTVTHYVNDISQFFQT